MMPLASARKQSQDARRLRDHFRSLLDQLIGDYASDERGLEIREIAGGFRFATKPQYHDAVRGFVKSLKPPLKLSLQALETLAVIAYKQPITAPEISEIRGVDSGGVLGSPDGRRKLINTAGRRSRSSGGPSSTSKTTEGVPGPLRPERHQRASQHRRVREDVGRVRRGYSGGDSHAIR